MIKRKKPWWQRAKENKKLQSSLTVLLPLLFGVVLVAAWQTELLHKLFHTDTFTLPLPTRIVSIIAGNWPGIWENVVATLIVTLVGLAVGSILGYLIAVLGAVFPVWGKGGLTVVSVFTAIPIVALAPVMNNWTRDVSSDANVRSMIAKILVVTLVCMANMSINAYRGLTELKPFAEDLMQSFAAKKKVVLFKLRIPNSVPYIFTALKVAVPTSVITAIVSEYFAEYIIGVGREIRENIVLAQYSTAWAYIMVACAIGIVLYGILLAVQSILMKKH